ncbi:MAG: tetratricopeptide repeat protein, partial [bacterium]
PTSSEESNYWYGRSVRFMIHEPWEYLQLQIKKLYLFWNHIEIPNNLNFNFVRHYSPLLDYNPFGFWLLGPLALAGMCVAFFSPGRSGTLRHHNALLTFLIIYILVTVAFFVCDRYRAPMIPLFSLFGSVGILFVIDLQRKRDYKQLLSLLVLTGIFAICVNSNLYAVPASSEAREYFTRGIISHEENENDSARVNLQKAYESDPYFPNLAYNIGVTEWINGNTAGAKEWFHRELQLNPASYNAFINLARIYFAERSMDSVKYFAESAVQLKPYLPPGYVWLAKAMMIEGRISAAESILVHGASLCDRRDYLYGEYLLAGINAAQNRMGDAEIRYRAVLAGIAGLDKFQQPLYEPEFAYSTAEKIGEELNVLKAKSYYGLGQISLSKKNLDSAAISFSLATRFDPRYADAFVDLAVTQLRLRRIREADTAMTRAIQLDPDNHLYWLNYGDVLVFENKYTEAARAYEKSLSLRSDFILAKERLAQLRRMF